MRSPPPKILKVNRNLWFSGYNVFNKYEGLVVPETTQGAVVSDARAVTTCG